jgi:hypothetical protein
MINAPNLFGPGGFLLPSARLRLEAGVEYVCGLGLRTTTEFIEELARRHDLVPETLDQLDVYRCLQPAMVRTAGGLRFRHCLCVVPGNIEDDEQ